MLNPTTQIKAGVGRLRAGTVLAALLAVASSVLAAPAAWTTNAAKQEATPKVSSTAGAQSKVFVAIYERGAAFQKGKHISEQVGIKDHIAYTEALGDKLVGGGLLTSPRADKVVGMIIFEAESAEAAEEWLRKDPGVMGKVLRASLRQWETSNIRAYRRE